MNEPICKISFLKLNQFRGVSLEKHEFSVKNEMRNIQQYEI